MDITQAEGQARIVGLEKIAERCKRDLFFLCKHVLSIDPDLITEHTHRDLCEITRPLLPNFDPEVEKPIVHLVERLIGGKPDKVMSDQFDPNRNKLLILMPRGTFKSSIVTIGFTLQYLLNNPDARVLIDSETYSKSKNFLAEIKGHLEGNEKFRAIFKHIYGVFPDDAKKNPSVRWTDAAVDLACRTRVLKEPSVSCSGIDRSINGMHFDLIIEDDLHSEKNVTNKDQIQQVIDHRKLAQSLLDPGMPRITIGTRWDYQDAYQHVLTNQRESYNILIRKAIEDDGTLLFPERLTQSFLDEQKRDQGNYIYSCNPGYAPILMADWSIKRLDQVQVGDEVIGFDTYQTTLVKTKVVEINSRVAMTQDVLLDSGRNIRCTPDHQWYTGRNDATHRPYRPVSVGSTMLEALNTDVGDNDSLDKLCAYNYLAAMIDGEGSAGYGSISIAQSESHNPQVCERITSTLKKLELPYKKGMDYTVINGGRQTKFDILRFGEPAKAYQIRKTLWDNPAKAVRRRSKVVSIIPYKNEKVYALTTETGNYICWGMLSKNCQYFNAPVDDDSATFKQSYMRRINWELVKDRPINWFMAIDPSYEGQYSDYAAFVLVGMDFQQELYVRQIHRAKMNYMDIINLMFDWYVKYKPRRIALETIATQKNIQYMLNNEQKRRGMWLPVQEIKTRTTTKEERIRALAPYYEFGRIHHVEESHQLDDLEYELLHFPKGTHDDMIDALATILDIAQPPTGRRVDSNERERKTFDKPRSPITGI